MKLSDTDGYFWDIVGELLYCEDCIANWSYNKNNKIVSLKTPGETTSISFDDLNKLLAANVDKIRSRWKTGNNFDGKLEVD